MKSERCSADLPQKISSYPRPRTLELRVELRKEGEAPYIATRGQGFERFFGDGERDLFLFAMGSLEDDGTPNPEGYPGMYFWIYPGETDLPAPGERCWYVQGEWLPSDIPDYDDALTKPGTLTFDQFERGVDGETGVEYAKFSGRGDVSRADGGPIEMIFSAKVIVARD